MRGIITTLIVAGLAHGAAAEGFYAEAVLQHDGPRIRATLIDAPRVPMSQLVLTDDRGIRVAATSLTEFKDSTDTVAIAFVIADSEIQMGNDKFTDEDQPDHYSGYFEPLQRAFGELDLVHAMPRGSQGMIVTYDDRAKVRVPMGPIQHLDAAALGTQKDYYGTVGTEMVSGITTAIDALAATRAARKAVIVIGDGNDTNNEAALAQLVQLKKRAAQEGIQTYAVIYKSVLSDPSNVITRMVPQSQSVASHDGIVGSLKSFIARIGNRYEVAFPAEAFACDGRPHDFTVWVAGQAVDPVTLQCGTVAAAEAGSCWFSRWQAQILIGSGLVLGIALLLKLRAGRAGRSVT